MRPEKGEASQSLIVGHIGFTATKKSPKKGKLMLILELGIAPRVLVSEKRLARRCFSGGPRSGEALGNFLARMP
jgi:hypothetical protein